MGFPGMEKIKPTTASIVFVNFSIPETEIPFFITAYVVIILAVTMIDDTVAIANVKDVDGSILFLKS